MDTMKRMMTPFRDFEDFFANLHWPRQENALQMMTRADWAPSVDISESDKEYLIKVEVPEVKKEDLHVQVNNGMLNISGERHHEMEDKKLHRTERYFGHFERSFKLPENVREDSIKAEQKNGMLYIHMGKTEIEPAPRKLEIKVG
ncbi:MAG TPA: Hsp20/alpha crystallin family protein [Xanthomonadales bacterium]|nr:Hsp20/alpha crystallin family protein [Xanthomonadales bacterium]